MQGNPRVQKFKVIGQWKSTMWKQEIVLRAASAAEARRIAERAGFEVLTIEREPCDSCPGRTARPKGSREN